MDELEILIQAILSLKDVTESKKQIVSELPKLEQQLQSDKSARVKIVAGLDIKKSASLIQAQLNTLSKQIQTQTPNISVGINTKGMSNANQSIQSQSSVKNQSAEERKLNEYLAQQISLTKQILTLKTQIAAINPNKDPNRLAELQRFVSLRETELSKLQQENVAMNSVMSAEQQRERIMVATTKEQQNLALAEQRSLDIEYRNFEIVSKKSDRLKAQIATYESINTKAAKIYKSSFDSLKNDLALAKTPEDIAKIQTQFATLKSTIKVAGKEGQTFFQKMIDGAKKFSSWMSLTTIISTAVRDIRKMVSTVVELDTALVDLQKTFKGTDADLKEFYYSANDVAKQLGVTTAEVIKQAAAWSRLGFSTKTQAIEMSKLSSMFASISPGMDVDTATDGLLSVIKAFGYETNEVLDGVMSKINKVGNEFGTSNSEIVEMLKRSSSAMKEANNNLADTIALETAAVEITRDAAGVGTAFKTLSMRLRGKLSLPPYKETYMLCA